MTNSQKYSIVGKDNEVVNQICKIDVLTTTVANTVPCAVLTFNRGYTAVPSVVGINAPRASTIANAIATSVGICVWVRGLSDALLADGTLQVTAVVEGRLA
jgi:hypothetical protein